MGSFLSCDGCGQIIRRGDHDEVTRLRLLTLEPGVAFWNGDGESWDFCSVGCIATWAVQRETEDVK